jgi:hypothetical protein
MEIQRLISIIKEMTKQSQKNIVKAKWNKMIKLINIFHLIYYYYDGMNFHFCFDDISDILNFLPFK